MRRALIVGLGLIGGSMAMALRGFEDFELIGVDRAEETLALARRLGVCDRVTDNAAEELPDADLVILCLHPRGILAFLAEHAARFRPGCLITDVCGVKAAVVEAAARLLPRGVHFIGCHPMAGREVSGLQHADRDLFRGAHFILTPPEGADEEQVALLERMAAYMGFGDVVRTTPERHDAMIAYTSQMMHVLAAAVCDDDALFESRGFEGGSFRGCTRVAALDVPLWTELFSLNRPALCAALERLEQNLAAYREVIERGDEPRLTEKLEYSSARKRGV